MEHDHDHHSHSHQLDFEKGNRNAFLIGIGLNFAFVIVEVIGGLYYNSISLLTDAGHNLSDVASLVLSLAAFWMAKKKSSASFTYGFKKTTILAALGNAVILLIAVGVLAYESFDRLMHPSPVEGGKMAWIAGAGIIVNVVSALFFYRQKNNELNAKSAYLHLMADALVSLGVVIGGILILYTGWYWLDPVIGLMIMVVILASTWGLLKDSFKLAIDAVPMGIKLDEIKNVMLKIPDVDEVSHVHVWPISTTENALTAHVSLSESLDFDQKLGVIKAIKHELIHHNIQHSTLEMEKAPVKK
ncbi:MAG: cation diffusion facilitator family transporter [Chitinophagaceae bacterium]